MFKNLALSYIALCAVQANDDVWDQYTVGDMESDSVIGGGSDYDTVVILLHGGGWSSQEWIYDYEEGHFGDITGMKFVFPTSPMQQEPKKHYNHHTKSLNPSKPKQPGGLWYKSFKNGCGLDDDCAYDIDSIHESADRVSALIQHEMGLEQIGGDASKVFLGGFSEGAQLTSYMQLAKLDFALGGAIVMDGYPLPPLIDMPHGDVDAAKANATYLGDDMNFMIWHGTADPIFPCNDTINTYNAILDVLGVTSVLKYLHIEDQQTHTTTGDELLAMVKFIKGDIPPSQELSFIQ